MRMLGLDFCAVTDEAARSILDNWKRLLGLLKPRH
jgi:hypothetical protein